MRYLLLMYGEEANGETPTAMPPERAAEWDAFWRETASEIPLRGWVALEPTTSAQTMRLQGDSMIDAGIFDGDYVVVKKQPTASPGQIVVAQTDEGEATLKYWYPEKGRIRLQPANPKYEPIWSVCEELDVVIHFHSGPAPSEDYFGAQQPDEEAVELPGAVGMAMMLGKAPRARLHATYVTVLPSRSSRAWLSARS